MFLKNSVVKKYIKDKYQKRVGKDFLLQLEIHIQHKLDQAGEIHNGSKKTLDSAVAIYVGINKTKK